ncbi:DNA alkylation repair protein [Dietzia sp. PP-33]|uniref:DNA alkylation repair protein n=1 Tax=Dietzia sp. PP-33 TaxID=2957500 RepID=UPI0029A37736|nr:DNA alkylation repair protein [Dietzia sp. PP-33]MDX2358907.1 DNA alkylation repair protein [Dietzia sp. PP-33]
MPFADELISPDVATALSSSIQSAIPERRLSELPQLSGALDGMSLRERADLLRDGLLADVPGDYRALADVVRSARDLDSGFTGWMIWPVTSAIATRATQENTAAAFSDAMALLAELTHKLTSEFAIRTLLRHDLDRALAVITDWTKSPDEHVRRLASEGTRPYLPWAVRVPEITQHPGVTVAILDALYRDDSAYVRRSVANHLNDLSRDAPDLVVETAQRWFEAPAPTTAALVRHGLRTLIKRGHPGALALLGFSPAAVDVDGPTITDTRVPWGGDVHFSAVLRNTGTEHARLSIDYIIEYLKANGTLSAKVFKLAQRDLAPGAEVVIDRKHSFRPLTTRRYYPGGHTLALQVNGIRTPPAAFELLPADAQPGT